MLLDAFNHFLPQAVFHRFCEIAPDNPGLKAFASLRALTDVEERLRILDRFGGYKQILCLSNPPIELLGPPSTTPELARFANDHLADVCRRNPDYFPGFVASLPMNNPEAAVLETDRAIKDLGACGVQVFTNVAGRPLSDPVFFPVFETVAKHDLPVLIHPMRTASFADYPTEKTSENEIWFTFGWPYETSACVTRLIFAGLLDRLPGLKLVTHHMGGMIPFFAEKIALGFSQIFAGTPEHNPLRDTAGLAREPAEYYQMLYADTATNGSAAAARCGYAFFGSTRTLFATDAPFDPVGGENLIRRTIAAVNALDLTADEQHAIFEGNARRLFKLEGCA